MPRKGPAYPITPEWQQWVRDRIEEMKRTGEVKSQNEIARIAKIAPSSLSEALTEGAVQTTVMPDIHRALKWPPPLMTPPIYVLRLVDYFGQLPEVDQGQWLERLRQEVAQAKRRTITN